VKKGESPDFGVVEDSMKLFSDNILDSLELKLFIFPECVVPYRERGMLEMPPNVDTYPNGKKDTVMCWPLFLLANKVSNPRNVCLFYCSTHTILEIHSYIHICFSTKLSSGRYVLWRLM